MDNLRSLYVDHEDVELTVGGALESHVAGALAGPTFLCILTEQFYRSRVGDRYFFERGDNEGSFTRDQLNEIRKASMARLFCDNGNNIEQMQPSAFLRVSTTWETSNIAAQQWINYGIVSEIKSSDASSCHKLICPCGATHHHFHLTATTSFLPLIILRTSQTLRHKNFDFFNV